MKIQEICFITVLTSLAFINCQTNNIRTNLRQCYNESAIPGIRQANERPPANLNILLEMIRRLEDANPTKSARELSILILQRLRQDGIRYTRSVVDLKLALPYMPTRLEAYLSTLVLQKFLPNNTLELLPGSLDNVDLCSLHYMISDSIDNMVRGDESRTCSRSARYTARLTRDAEGTPNKDIETVVEGIDGFVRTLGSGSSAPEMSQCPIELGVVYTNYGTIKAGIVLAGIAAGLNNEQVQDCDNRYVATIAGELAETAMAQATSNIKVGAPGGWNNTINPKYFFLQRNQFLQFTDAEIRGSVDGLYMAMKIREWTSKFSGLKISQVLDMYYSPNQKGVFASDFTACNRNKLYSSITTTDKLETEVLCLMAPLDDAANYGSTLSDDAFPQLRTSAIQSFNNYFPKMSTEDVSCNNENVLIERAATELLIFLDSSWKYETVLPVVSAILDGIDVNRFGSRYTVFLGPDFANVTITKTNNLLDFHKFYNRSFYQEANSGNTGFDYTKAFKIVEDQVKSKMNNNTYSGGESTIVLLIPKASPNDNERAMLEQKKASYKLYLPDVSVLVLGRGTSSDYSSILVNPSKDFIQLIDTTSENDHKAMVRDSTQRIINVPRALVNPNCGAEFSGSTSTFQHVDYVEPSGVNYYRISPNYFYAGGGENRILKVTENSYGAIDVCISRDQPKPSNQTSTECQTIRSTVKTFNLAGYCAGSLSDCAPIYLSVTGKPNVNYKCREYFCRYPNDIKYTISMENVGCTSGALQSLANFMLVVALLAICRF